MKAYFLILIFLVFSLLFGIFFVEVVSAVDINWAALSNGATAAKDLTGYGANWVTSNWYDGDVNHGINGDRGNYFGGGKREDGRPVYITYIVNFSGAAPVINNITLDYVCASAEGNEQRKLELWNGSEWIVVSQNDALLPPTTYYDGEGPNSLIGLDEQATITGPWYNISRIRIYFFGTSGKNSEYVAIFNVQAMGPASCGDGNCNSVVGEDCNTCPDDCGACPEIHSCSSSNDIIMKLFSSNNSYGALWNDTTYLYDICCSDIFGISAPECGPTTPHPYKCTNPVVWLYQNSNSNASINNLTGYNIPVCYGNLSCHAESAGSVNSCIDTDEEIVVRLAQENNSHISNASFTDYTIKICCKSVGGATVTRAYWADMTEQEISQADLNDRVKLMVAGSGMENKKINYTIYECEAVCQFTGGTIRLFDKKIAQTSTIGFTSWIANETGTFYFEADVEGIGSQTSRDLEVISPEDNEPPYANILTPKICEIYFTGENIAFTQNSSDKDDNIAVKWDFGDGSTSTQYNVEHVYTTGGQKNIVLTVTDERGKTDKARTTILVVDKSKTSPEKYICAYINTPEWGDNIFGFDIFFNASDTYAINASCNGVSCSSIECIAGPCKNQTVGGGGIPVTGTIPNWIGFENIDFSWSFDDGATYVTKGMWGAWFNKTFGTIGSHWAKLTASINLSSESTETEFSNYINSTCSIDLLSGGKWVWWNEFGIPQDPLTEPGACLWENGINPPHCCPPGYACVDPTGGDSIDAICKISGSDYCANIVVCDDYTSQAECQNDTCGKGVLQPAGTCGGTIESLDVCGSNYFTSKADRCACFWNETAGKCHLKENLWSTIYRGEQIVYRCEATTEHGKCIDGLMNIKKTGNLIYENGTLPPQFQTPPTQEELELCEAKICKDYEGTIMCEKPSIALKFFNLTNLIVAVAIIIIIYVLISRKKIVVRKARKKKL